MQRKRLRSWKEKRIKIKKCLEMVFFLAKILLGVYATQLMNAAVANGLLAGGSCFFFMQWVAVVSIWIC